MKYFICAMSVLLTSMVSFSENKKIENTAAMVCEKNLDIDELLDEARALGIAEESIEIKPISYAEYLFRKMGGSVLMALLSCKHYFQRKWNEYTNQDCGSVQ